jgi:hypothetical protein
MITLPYEGKIVRRKKVDKQIHVSPYIIPVSPSRYRGHGENNMYTRGAHSSKVADTNSE